MSLLGTRWAPKQAASDPENEFQLFPFGLLGSGLPTCFLYSSDSFWLFPSETSMIPPCFAASVGPTSGRGGPPGPGSHPGNRRKQVGVTRACTVEVTCRDLATGTEVQVPRAGPGLSFYKKGTALGLRLFSLPGMFFSVHCTSRGTQLRWDFSGTCPSHPPRLARPNPCSPCSSRSYWKSC